MSKYFLRIIICFLFLYGIRAEAMSVTPSEKADLYEQVRQGTFGSELTPRKSRLNLEEALAVLDSVYPEKAIRDHRQEVVYLIHKTKVLLNYRDFEQALQTSSRALELLKKMNEPKVLAEVTFLRGDILMHHGELAAAFDCFFTAQQIMSKLDDDLLKAGFDFRLGQIFFKEGQFQQAKMAYLSSYKQFVGGDSLFFIAYKVQEIMDNIALCYMRQDSFRMAQHWLDKTLEYVRRLPVRTGQELQVIEAARAVIKGNYATAWLNLGDTARAEELYWESIRANFALPYEKIDAAILLSRLADLYIYQNRLKEAGTVLKRLDSLIVLNRFEDRKANYFMLRSRFFEKMNEPDSALFYERLLGAENEKIRKSERILFENNLKNLFSLNESQKKLEKLQKDQNRNHIVIFLTVAFIMLLMLALGVGIWSYRTVSNKSKELEDLNYAIRDTNFDLEEALRELKLTTRQKDRIMAIVAHDLRNPLNAVSSITGLLRGPDGQSKEQREYWLEMIQQACISSLELIEEVMLMSEVQEIHSRKGMESVDLVRLVEDSLKMLEFRAEEKKQLIQWMPHVNTLTVWADEAMLRRCLSNLVTNAIKFSNDGSEIYVRVFSEGNQAVLEVTDHGIGIPASIIDAIFQEYGPAKRTGTRGERTFGLGLSIVKRIVEAHDGSITVISKEGVGSTFRISLPIHSGE